MQSSVIGGGSLLIAWQLKDRRVLIVGGGEVASQRIDSILVTDAHITVLSPLKGLNEKTQALILAHPERVTYYDRPFSGPTEIQNMDMVLTALDDVAVSREIVDLCRNAHIPVNAADIPDCCDFYFGSQIRDGPLQIMISTNGNGPRMASIIKEKLKRGLQGNEGKALERLGLLREKLKELAPGVGGAVGRRRMGWMSRLCNQWTMDEFAALDEQAMQMILEKGWEANEIPDPEEIIGRVATVDAYIPPLPAPSPSLLLPTITFILGAASVTLLHVFLRRR